MRKLKKNLALNMIYQILILIIPLITSTYLSRILGADGIGRYSYTYSIALYFTYFTVLGLTKYGNRIIASVQNDLDKRSRTFWEIYTMQFTCFLLCITAYIFYCFFVAKDKSMALVQTIFVFSALFDINWFFFGMEMFDKIVIRNIVIKLFTTFLIFITVKTKTDVKKYACIMSLGYLMSQLALWPYLKKNISLIRISVFDIKKHIIPNLTMFLPVIAVSIYKIMSKIMLGIMSTNAVVGYYENAEKIINVPLAIITALGTVMLPRVTSLISENKDQQVFKFREFTVLIVSAFTVAAFFGIIAVSDTLSVLMWGNEFIYSGKIMRFLASTLIFLGIGDVLRSQFLIPYKYDKVYVISAFLGAFVNIFINILLIPHYDAIGAAIGIICAEVIVCGYQIFMVRHCLPIKIYMQDILIFSIFGLIMLYAISILPDFDSKVVSLIIDIAFGGVVYVIPTGIFTWERYKRLLGGRQ